MLVVSVGCSRWDVGFGERAGDPMVDAASPSNNEIDLSVRRHLSPGFLLECSLPRPVMKSNLLVS